MMHTLALAFALAAPPPEAAAPPPQESSPPPESIEPTTSEAEPAAEPAEATPPAEASVATTQTTAVEEDVKPPPEPAKAPASNGKKPAKKRGRVFLMWSMGQTVGDSYDFIDRFTFSGIDTGLSYRVLPFFSAGISGGFMDFRDKFRRTITRENATLRSTQLRILGAYSILATGMFHIPNRSPVEPYVGLGLGTYFTFRSLDIGWVYAENSGWHFGLAPALGVEIDAGKIGVLLGSRFNWVAKAGDSPQELFFTFNLGVNFGVF